VFSQFFKTATENEKYRRQIDLPASLAVFISAAANTDNWILAGRAAKRFALQATALGLKHAFINQPVDVAKFRPELAQLIGVPGQRPDLITRFGYGPKLPFSARRPVESVSPGVDADGSDRLLRCIEVRTPMTRAQRDCVPTCIICARDDL
jgi:hypothetical protein